MTGSSDARLPAAIGRYRILKELGRGMMGVVYLAQDPALDRLIALKTIDLAFSVPPAERASFEQRFLGEARVAARLQHPGIVVVHDVGRDDEQGILYIALEYLQGRTLSEMAGGNAAPLPWAEALRIGAGVARALHHAHARSIVHRDVKPANVMLVASGQPKIMDFGIAKVPSMELTSSGQFFGTPLYMSPEQAAGDPLDGRSDLFSLGAVLYFLLTGRHAFGAESVVRVLARVATEEPPPPSALAPEVPPAVDALVMRALRKAPAERFASGDAMADAIDELVAGRPPAAPLEGTLEGLLLEPELAPGFEPLLPDPLAPMPPPGALRTTPSRRPDEALGLRSAALSGTGSSLRARAEGPPSSLADPALQSMAVVLPQAARPRRRWYERKAPWVAALVALLLGGALLLGRKEAKPSPPAARETRAPAAGRDDTPPATAPAASDDVPEGSGRLEVDFEHHLRRGRIQLWVDDEQALDTPFDSRVTQQILSLRLRKGNLQKVLPVDAGRHEVRVRLTWSGRVRESVINGTFAAGQSRTLEVRVSRVLNDLSLKWE